MVKRALASVLGSNLPKYHFSKVNDFKQHVVILYVKINGKRLKCILTLGPVSCWWLDAKTEIACAMLHSIALP